MRKYPKLTVAAVQAAPVFLNMDASVEKACRLIRDAADKGAKLVAFPESFLPGYPYWCWLDDPISTMSLTQTLFTCALECPGPELGSIAQCAKDNCIYVCISATEREASSVYCTQFLFDDDGNLLGKHRKLKPMHSEKMIWGEGDASTMKVYETPYGNMGSMLSCEHMSPMNAMIMCAQREEIHIASYPALPRAPINYRTYHASMTSANCYAVSNACYVMFSTQVMDQYTVDTLCKDHPQFRNDLPTCDINGIGGGNACILDPFGEKIGECLPENQEGVVVADVDLALLGVPNFFGDTTGHYCNPAVYLEVNTEQTKIVRFNEAMTDGSMEFDQFINC